MKIKYNAKFDVEMNRIVNRYNKRVEQANEKAGREVLQKRTVSELKNRFFKRSELNRELREMERINNRNALKLVTVGDVEMTKYEKEYLERGLRYAKSKRTRIHKRMKTREDKDDFYGLHSDRYDQTKVNREALNKYNVKDLTEESYERLKQSVKSETNRSYYNKLFYDEFFNRLTEGQDLADVDPVLVNTLKNKLSEIDPDDFLEIYNHSPYFKGIMEYIETKGFRKQMYGYKGKKSQLAIEKSRFNEIMNDALQDLPRLIKKYV